VKKQLSYAAALLVLSAAAGCGPAPSHQESTVAPDQGRRPITVQVTNDHMQDVDVFVVDNGVKFRLGMLTTGQTQRYPLPWGVALTGRDLRVVVHPIGGGGDFVTENFVVNPGDLVQLSIRPVLPQSSLSIYAR
jgi:hypothetical protein